MPHSSGGGSSHSGSNSSTTTTTTKKPNYGTTLVVSKHVTKVPQYTTKTVTVTDYSDFTITKTNYFKSCNLDDLLSAINKIISDLRSINYSFAISGIWEATSGKKLSHELSKLPTYANILLACLQGYVEVINKARGIKSLQKQVDQVDSSSHDYNTVKSLQDQINSQISWFDGGVAAIKNQTALPASVNAKYSGTVDSTYRFDYGAVSSVANQAKSESNKLVSIYKQYCDLKSKVKKDSYLYYGWNVIVLVFDKMIGKRDSIENWWTNYMQNIKGIENALPDNEYAITDTETKKEATSHDAAATPNLDSYKSDHKGSTSTFRVATGSHNETKTVKTGDKDLVSYTYSNVPRTTPSNGYIRNFNRINNNDSSDYTNRNAGWENSGRSRDEYDSDVRRNYQIRTGAEQYTMTPEEYANSIPIPHQPIWHQDGTPLSDAEIRNLQDDRQRRIDEYTRGYNAYQGTLAEQRRIDAREGVQNGSVVTPSNFEESMELGNAIRHGTATQQQIDAYVRALEANRDSILDRYGGTPPTIPQYGEPSKKLEKDVADYIWIELELEKYNK